MSLRVGRAFTLVELPAVSRAKRAAFTLVELLVVIGIISVLIGILLPTLAGARRSSGNVRCAANLRSLGSAAVLYANEMKGYVPTYLATYGTARVPWYDQMNRYVFNRPAVGTPASVINQADFERSIFVGCTQFPFERFAGAVLNTSVGYSMTALPLAPLSLEENRFTQGSTTGGRYFKLTEFKNPANRALMGEMNGWGGLLADGADPTYNYRAAPRNNAKGDIDYFRHTRPLDMTRAGTNVLFADGHVELLTPWGAWYAVRDPARRAAGSDKGY